MPLRDVVSHSAVSQVYPSWLTAAGERRLRRAAPFGLAWSTLADVTYIVQRRDRFYVVAYDGLDPLTGRERRRWCHVGSDRFEAEAIAARLDGEQTSQAPARGGPVTVTEFLTQTWLPHKRRQVRPTTAYRYAWFVDLYIAPAIGDIRLRRLRPEHLDHLYETLATTGGRSGTGLAPKTVLEVHMLMRAAGAALQPRAAARRTA